MKSKQRVIEQRLQSSFADEDHQVMKQAIDEEKRSLDQTVPDTQAAIISLNTIKKLHTTEMKSFTCC